MEQLTGDLSIGFVVSHPFYGSPGSVLRIKELSTSLSSFGVTVHVYTPYLPDESWGTNVFFHEIPNITSTLRIQDSLYNLARWVLNKPFFVRRIMSKSVLDKMVSSFAKRLKATIKEDIDVIQGEQEIAAASCVRIREDLGVPVIASLHNIWPEELVITGLIEEDSEEYTVLQESEKETLSESDLNVVVSEEMALYLREKYSLNPRHILVVPPGGRTRMDRIVDRNEPFKVVFAGLVAKRANLGLFIKSIPFVLERYPDTKFFITNRGEDLKRIRKLAKEIGVSPEYYWVPKSAEFYEFLSSCHAGVVTSSNDITRRMGPPVKLFDYLSVGLPVVANDIGGWTKIVEDEDVGILTTDDPECFAQGILMLIEDRQLHSEFGLNALSVIEEKYNWDSCTEILLKEYERILN